MKKRNIVFWGILLLVIVLNVAAWNSTAFSDWYITNVFPLWVNTYGRVTGMFSFSVGEWMIAAGLALAGFALALGLVWAVAGLRLGAMRMVSVAGRCRICLSWANGPGEAVKPEDRGEAARPGRKSLEGLGSPKRLSRFGGLGRFSRGFYRFFAWVLLAVCLVMTLNCFILYHGSAFSRYYFGEDLEEYGLTELIAVYNMVAENCNRLARDMDRDENGMVLYGGGAEKDKRLGEMADKARELMGHLGEDYPRLAGYYPRPKALLSSDFMCQQHMQGYYFPFSMEANYNDVMHILNIPSTMCHELAHLKGYIYEDEANFIAYLACVQAEDAFFRYAGYLSVLTYLSNDLYKAREEDPAAFEEAAAAIPPAAVDGQVWMDNVFVTQEEWDRINKKALIDTETVDKAADVFIDTNLKVNGISDGKASYSRVVRLLLQYYSREWALP